MREGFSGIDLGLGLHLMKGEDENIFISRSKIEGKVEVQLIIKNHRPFCRAFS